jgi:hypothetical protein
MNLGQAKKKALSLMLEYSNDGIVISDGENADYLAGMNGFAHDAQMEISKRVSVEASYIYNQVSSLLPGFQKYELPQNFKILKLLTLNDVNFYDFSIRNKKVWIPNVYNGQLELFYEKHPSEINNTTLDSYEFEIDQHTHHLIPYYLGGMALAEEKDDVSSKLLNIYYQMLSNLEDYKKAIPSTIQSVDGW